MKKILSIILIMFILSSCNTSKKTTRKIRRTNDIEYRYRMHQIIYTYQIRNYGMKYENDTIVMK